ncbi:MAG TPA: enoyl-CoA hydratase/isomerase family protein [Mycobacterium sp.]
MNLDPDSASSLRLRVVELAAPRAMNGTGPLVAVGSAEHIEAAAAQAWLERATFTLTEDETSDRRAVTVPSVEDAVRSLAERVDRWPQAAAICDDVLRSIDPDAPTYAGLVTESLAYSTLQSGPEFADWLAQRGPALLTASPEPVLVERHADALTIRLNRPDRHNAFSTEMRAALLDALAVAYSDNEIRDVVLAGNGPSFCSGGDLAEFGSFDDPATAHFARTRYSPALALDELATRLGDGLIARVHGQVLGSGLEMAAFCGRVHADAQARIGLPELELGLLPGAGGTLSITRRIGRWRTAYLVLSGRIIDAATALAWGLVDDVTQ